MKILILVALVAFSGCAVKQPALDIKIISNNYVDANGTVWTYGSDGIWRDSKGRATIFHPSIPLCDDSDKKNKPRICARSFNDGVSK